MAVRPESRLALEMAHQKFMPAEEGAAHFLDELENGSHDAEAIFFDWPVERDTNRSPLSVSEVEQYWLRSGQLAESPLLESLFGLHSNKALTAEIRFNPLSDPFLTQHRLKSVPILPAVVGLEAIAEAACLLNRERKPTGFSDFEIHRAWNFNLGVPELGRVTVRNERGTFRCRLTSDYRNRQGVVTDPSRKFVTASVIFDRPMLPIVEWFEPTATWYEMQYDSEAVRSEQNMVWHGDVFQDLRQISISGNRLWGRMIAPSPEAIRGKNRVGNWIVPSALLDSCLQACSTLTYVNTKTYHLPVAFESLHLFQEISPGANCTVQVQLKEEHDDHSIFDFAVFNEEQEVMLAAQGYRAVIIFSAGGAS
jgi:hypothetical protein